VKLIANPSLLLKLRIPGALPSLWQHTYANFTFKFKEESILWPVCGGLSKALGSNYKKEAKLILI
jgi:hypothetical protein